MQYNFDTPIDRYHTNCLKFDYKKEYGQPDDVFPMWVADMDYPVLPEVTEAIIKRAKHPVYGYTLASDAYYESVMRWMETRHQYITEKEWYTVTPGVVFAIAMAIRAFTNPGDAVMVNTPVYAPFFKTVRNNDRIVVECPLVYERKEMDEYRLDFAEIEKKIAENNVKMYILCSPHNPVGRVWTEEELRTLGNILKKYNLLLVCDEIHMDFVFSGHKHHVFAGLSKEFEDFTITCTAPSKTFNLAGLQISNIIISNEGMREKFRAEMSKLGYEEPNVLGLEACQAAYEYGADYMDQLVKYLEENKKLVIDYLAEHIPAIKLSLIHI